MGETRVLVGICGIGYGHTIRQSLVIEALIRRGACVAAFCFGQSLAYLRQYNPHGIPFWEVHVPWVNADRDGIDWEKTNAHELTHLTRRAHLTQVAFQSARKFFDGLPDLCISDYEPISACFAYENGLPLVTIDQQSKFLGYQTEDIGEYSRIEERSRLSYFFPYAEARYACSFYTVGPKQDQAYKVQLIPAPVRNDIVDLSQRSPQPNNRDHSVVVYFSPYGPISQGGKEVLDLFSRFRDWRFIIYTSSSHLRTSLQDIPNHIQIRSFDRQAFSNDLATASCLISTAGHTLLSEAIYLKIPIYTIPLATYDQHYCAKMVEQHQIGFTNTRLTEPYLHQFLSNLPFYRSNFSADNPSLTVSPEVSETMLDSVLSIASVSSKGRRIHIQSSTTDGPASKDRLYLPDFEEILDNPDPHPGINYTTAVLKPTMRCTYNCIACQDRVKDWWNPDSQDLTLEQWLDILQQIKDLGFKVVTLSGGEPLLYSSLTQMIQAIRAHDLLPILNTNGVHLPSKRLSQLCEVGLAGINFSLDSPRPSIHDALRRSEGAWKRCIDAIRSAREHDEHIWFAIRMVLTAQNLMDLPEMIRLAADLGATSLKLSYLEWSYHGSPLLPDLKLLHWLKDVIVPGCQEVLGSLPIPEAQRALSASVIQNLLYCEKTNTLENYAQGIYWADPSFTRHCMLPYSLVIVNGDGSVLPCNAAEYARLSLPGSLAEVRLEEILGSNAMKHFRAHPPDFCRYCPMPLHLTLPLRDTIV